MRKDRFAIMIQFFDLYGIKSEKKLLKVFPLTVGRGQADRPWRIYFTKSMAEKFLKKYIEFNDVVKISIMRNGRKISYEVVQGRY